MQIGPKTPAAQALHQAKYRSEEESFDDYCLRYARSTTDDDYHFKDLLEGLREQRILPAGRQQLAVGRPYEITAMNCYVGGTIEDSSEGIMDTVKNSMLTLRSGGGCGWDFSTIRPWGDPIRGLGLKAYATGPVSFMSVWDAMCGTVLSAGHRRGAMMGVLRVDHPDIMRFINSKQDDHTLTNFNISVAVTDEFMEALEADDYYTLIFNGQPYTKARAADVWAQIMERNWDWAEPGVLFIDRINEYNNLWYTEQIAATNPCGEQPLPPNGACLLGSINLVKYIKSAPAPAGDNPYYLDFGQIEQDVEATVRAFDNVIDRTHYPLHEQSVEQKTKRRMGIGVTGMANCLEVLGFSYGSEEYIEKQSIILATIRDAAYNTSIDIAKTKGPFPLYTDQYVEGPFIETLPMEIRERIIRRGIRNSHLLSIAPTGTISQCADNVSSGIEPPYSLEQRRLIYMPEGQSEILLKDYALEEFKVKCRTAQQVSAQDHIKVMCAAQTYVDSSVSKTCNVNGLKLGEEPREGKVSFEDFCNLYLQAYKGGAKGCTTFNMNGKRAGILTSMDEEEENTEGACFIDPETGLKTCDG